jgi:hypothetical protein
MFTVKGVQHDSSTAGPWSTQSPRTRPASLRQVEWVLSAACIFLAIGDPENPSLLFIAFGASEPLLHMQCCIALAQSLFTDFELLFLERVCGLPPSGTDLALAVRDGIQGCSTISVYALLQRLSSQKAIGFNKAGPFLKHGAKSHPSPIAILSRQF